MPDRNQLPMLSTRAALQPKTFDAERRTVELTWSTGATVRRFDWLDGPYLEELSMDPAHVRMDRLNTGAPLLGNHNASDLSGVIGVVERAWLDDGKGRAIVRFSERADVEPILADVKAGILRNISVGYQVHEYEVEKPTERGGMPLYRATDWEPMEVSIVTVPADASAQVRGSQELHPVTITLRNPAMSDPNEKSPVEDAPETPIEEPTEAPADESAISARALKIERTRVAGILDAVRTARLDQSMADKLIASGKALDECRADVIRAWSASVDKTATPSRVESGMAAEDKALRGAEQAMLYRAGFCKDDLTNNEYRGLRLTDLVRMSLERSGVRTVGMSYDQMAQTILRQQTTSDFPVLLENTMHKMLLASYAAAPDQWRAIAKVGSVSDFRAWKRLRTGTIGNLDVVLEGGELTNKTIGDAVAESVQAARYGNIISVTPETIVNDDLDYIASQTSALGRAAARTVEAAVFAKIVANPTMGDGEALFSAAHANLQGSGGAISVATLEAGRVAMASQMDVDGNDYLNIRPAVLVTTIAEGGSARVVVNAVYDPDTASKLQRPNMVNGLVGTIVDTPRVPVGFYLFANPADAPVIEVVFLDGNQTPRIAQEENFRTKGLSWSVELPFGVGVIDYRGAYFNDGA
jgi:phage major head subunit gpT-like protein